MNQPGRRSWLGPPARHALAVFIALVGMSFLGYPALQNALYDQEVAAMRARFDESCDWRRNAERDELFLFMRAENQRLHRTGQSGLVDAFSYETPAIDLIRYGIEDGLIGFVAVPSAGIDLPVFLGANTDNMRRGATHLTQTSYPIGGDSTNTVIAAHRGGTRAMFRNIHDIALGDDIVVTTAWGTLRYEAVEIEIIAPDDIDRVKIRAGRDLITLITCNPLGANHQRYVVVAERVG